MAEFLFVTPEEMTATTVLGGNVDVDKYIPCVASVQLTIIEPLLGTLLYDKIATDAEAETLAGLYLELYDKFVKPITKNMAVAEYIEIGSYMVSNGGIYKHTGDNIEVVDKQEVQFLAGKYRSIAQAMVIRFNKWICKNHITEYKTYQDEVNAKKDVVLTAGWKLDGNTYDRKWWLQ